MVEFINEFHFTSEAWTLLAPCIMIALDFITGLVKAWGTRSFESKKMRAGLTKKVGELAILVVGEVLSCALGLPKYIMSFLSLYIVFMELMSIFENLDTMGVKIPKFVKNVINNTDDALENDDFKALNDKAEALQKEIDDLKK